MGETERECRRDDIENYSINHFRTLPLRSLMPGPSMASSLFSFLRAICHFLFIAGHRIVLQSAERETNDLFYLDNKRKCHLLVCSPNVTRIWADVKH